jgi:hypothetical protein
LRVAGSDRLVRLTLAAIELRREDLLAQTTYQGLHGILGECHCRLPVLSRPSPPRLFKCAARIHWHTRADKWWGVFGNDDER